MEFAGIIATGIGVIALLLRLSITAGRYTCPVCRVRFYLNRVDRSRIRFGRFPCPKCGKPVEVDH